MADDPSMTQVLQEVIDERLSEVYTAVPGKVQSWSRTDETANVIPLVQRQDGEGFPVVTGARVMFPAAYFDLSAGDTGILLFSMWDFSRWWRTGSVGAPEQVDTHAIDAAVFLPGLRNKANSRAVPSGATVLDGDDVRLGVDSASEAVIRGDAYTGHEDTFLAGLLAWVNTTETFLYGGPAGVFQPIITAFRGQLSGDLSTKVSVD